MFLAQAAHSAFLRDTLPAAGPALELLPARHRQHPRFPFPCRDLLLQPLRRGMSPSGVSTAGSGCSACSTLQVGQEFCVSSLEYLV